MEPRVGTGFAQGYSAHQRQNWDENPGLLPLGLNVSRPKVGGKPSLKLSRAMSFLNLTVYPLGRRQGYWPEKVAAQADDGILGCVQANVALKGAVLPSALASTIAAATGPPCTGVLRGCRGRGPLVCHPWLSANSWVKILPGKILKGKEPLIVHFCSPVSLTLAPHQYPHLLSAPEVQTELLSRLPRGCRG